jgi:hypothetical protein
MTADEGFSLPETFSREGFVDIGKDVFIPVVFTPTDTANYEAVVRFLWGGQSLTFNIEGKGNQSFIGEKSMYSTTRKAKRK